MKKEGNKSRWMKEKEKEKERILNKDKRENEKDGSW